MWCCHWYNMCSVWTVDHTLKYLDYQTFLDLKCVLVISSNLILNNQFVWCLSVWVWWSRAVRVGAWYSGDRGVSRCRISSLRSETTTAITSVFVRKLEYFGIIFLFLFDELGKSNHVPFQLPRRSRDLAPLFRGAGLCLVFTPSDAPWVEMSEDEGTGSPIIESISAQGSHISLHRLVRWVLPRSS